MRKLCRVIVGMLAVIMLAGCATAYQKSGLTGGYGETRIDDSHYVVHFDGNGYTDKDRVWNLWIYRCAELTKEKGFSYFSIEPIQSNINKTGFVPEQNGHLYAAVLDSDADAHVIDVRSGGGGGRSVYIPGGYISGGTIVTWHSKAIIAMYGATIPQRKLVLQAQLVLDMLAEYVHTNGASVPPQHLALFEQAAYAMAPDNQIVNVHQYMQAHLPGSAGTTNAYNGFTQRRVISPLPASVNAAPASLLSSVPSTTSASLAMTSMAQTVATQMGCGSVRVNNDAIYVASCSSYDLWSRCDDRQCHPVRATKIEHSE